MGVLGRLTLERLLLDVEGRNGEGSSLEALEKWECISLGKYLSKQPVPLTPALSLPTAPSTPAGSLGSTSKIPPEPRLPSPAPRAHAGPAAVDSHLG